jgi:hypothetical protein
LQKSQDQPGAQVARESIADSLARRCPETQGSIWILQYGSNSSRQRTRVPRVDEHAVNLVVNDFGYTTCSGRDDWEAHRHRFNDRDTQRLFPARQTEDVGPAMLRAHIWL